MSKQSKSQWDFGELFPAETTRRVLTVSELTTQVKRLLEKSIGLLWVTGEVTNLRVRKPGDRINIECDILAKHVDRLLTFRLETDVQVESP